MPLQVPRTGSNRYTKRVTFLRDLGDGHENPDGQIEPNYQQWIKRWAKPEYVKGDEFVVNNRVQAERQHRWRIPSDPQVRKVTPEMRIKCEGRIFNIIAVEDADLEGIEVIIDTKEVVDGA